MQDTRALKNPTNMNSWRAWEGEAYQRSGFHAIMGSVFALTLAFVMSLSLFAGALGDDRVSISLVGFVLFLAISFALMALAVSRLSAWKRSNPWTPPS